MRLVAAVAALLRRLRAERGVIFFVFVVVALTSFVVAAAPRLYSRVADDGLRYEVGRGTAIQRNLQFTTVGHIRAQTDDPLGGVAARGEAFRADLPASVERLVGGESFVIETSRLGLADPPRYTTFVTLRQQSGLDGLLDLASGHWPERAVPAPGDPADAPRVLEVAMSAASAAEIGVVPGDRLAASVDRTDPVGRLSVVRDSTPTIEIVISGLFTVRDPTDPQWFDDHSLFEAAIGGSAESPIAYTTAIFAPAAYADVLGLGPATRLTWDLSLDADRLDARDLDGLTRDLRQLSSSYATTGSSRPDAILLHTGLGDAIGRFEAQRTTVETALALAVLGPAAVAAGAVALLGILVVRRRRHMLALARGRGASSGQLLAAQLGEGLLVTVPAALTGLAVAIVLVPAPDTALSSTGSILVALGATALLLLATWPAARRARRDLERDDPPVFRLSPRRLVFETLIVGLSLSAVWLLRERGLTTSGTTGHPLGFDPFVAAAPLLVGLAVGLVVIRLLPIPVRALGWVAARRRNLVPVLGLRSLGRHSSAGYLPLLILSLTVAIGTVSVVMAATLVRGMVLVSWQDVGADLRLEAPPGRSFDPAIDVRAVDGVEAAAPALQIPDAGLSTGPTQRSSALLVAVDPAALDDVVAGSPMPLATAAVLAWAPTGPEAGTVDQPIPSIVSDRPGPTGAVLDIGDRFTLMFRGQTMAFTVVDRRSSFPGIALGTSFVVAPMRSVVDGWNGTSPGPSTWFVRGPADVADALQQAAAGTSQATVVSRYERLAAMRDAPLVAAVVGGFALAVGIAVLYASLAVVTVLALEAQRRSREMAFLRTLGLTDLQLGQLTIVEQGVPLMFALLIGIAVGLGVAWLIAPGIDLTVFSHAQAAIGIQIDWPTIGEVTLSIVAVVVVAVAATSWVARRSDVSHALRMGEDA